MTTKIFVNLPVKNLRKSIDFYTKIGFTNNPKFTDGTAACMALNDNIFVMLLSHNRFKDFTNKDIADASISTEVLLAIDLESREKVDELIDVAKASGGTVNMEAQDYDWMYQQSFEDLDGHQWEVLYMDDSMVHLN